MYYLKVAQKYMGGPAGLPHIFCAAFSHTFLYNLHFLLKTLLKLGLQTHVRHQYQMTCQLESPCFTVSQNTEINSILAELLINEKRFFYSPYLQFQNIFKSCLRNNAHFCFRRENNSILEFPTYYKLGVKFHISMRV